MRVLNPNSMAYLTDKNKPHMASWSRYLFAQLNKFFDAKKNVSLIYDTQHFRLDPQILRLV